MSIAPTSIGPGSSHHWSRWLLAAVVGVVVGGIAIAMLYRFDVVGGSSSSSSTVVGSGVAASEARDVAPFTSVELAGANNVVIHFGNKQSVVVRADDNLLHRVTTRVQSGTLVIANTPGSFTTKSPMSVAVDVPSLASLTLTGSGNIVVDGIETESLTVSLPGSGTVTASGTAKQLDVTVSGSGNVQFTRLVADDVQAVVSGSGAIFVTATKSLDGSVSGSGAIMYSGNPPDVTKNVTGSGAIVATS